jgi:hypothetical protein
MGECRDGLEAVNVVNALAHERDIHAFTTFTALSIGRALPSQVPGRAGAAAPILRYVATRMMQAYRMMPAVRAYGIQAARKET